MCPQADRVNDFNYRIDLGCSRAGFHHYQHKGKKIKSFESRHRFAVAKRAKYRIVDSTLGHAVAKLRRAKERPEVPLRLI
jgi:hypothetical protein